MHETRGEKVFDYCYDANGQLYAVSYKANSSTDAVTYYYAHNWRGDITSIYDGDGNMVAKYEYDDWGNVLTVTDASNSEITDPAHIANLNPFRYRSYYYDSESGLYYLMSRYYDPVTHRFVNADGYLQAGEDILDANMFAYCGNNPVCRIDSKGNSWWGIAATCFAIAAICAVSVVAAPILAAAAVSVGITASVSSVIVASVAVGTIATGIGIYATSKAISNSKITYSSTTITSDTRNTRNETTTIYRYGGTNPGNFVPSSRDVETNTGLSFSTVPRPGAAMTTIEELNATGVVYAYQDSLTHVTVKPIGGTIAEWRNQGTSSVWTKTIKSLVVKWDGSE